MIFCIVSLSEVPISQKKELHAARDVIDRESMKQMVFTNSDAIDGFRHLIS